MLRCSNFKRKVRDLRKRAQEKKRIQKMELELRAKDKRLAENLRNMKKLTGEEGPEKEDGQSKLYTLVETIRKELEELKKDKD